MEIMNPIIFPKFTNQISHMVSDSKVEVSKWAETVNIPIMADFKLSKTA